MRISLPCVLSLLTAVPLCAQTELLVNGDFETGDFTGWTRSGIIDVNDGTLVPGGTGAAQAPIGGAFDVVTNGLGPGIQTLSQQITVPTGLTGALLSWDDQINNLAGVFEDPNHEFRVLIQDLFGATLAEVYSTNPGDAATQPITSRSFDVTSVLAPFAGQDVLITWIEEDNLFFFNLYLDNCSLLTSTTPGALALFSTYGDGCGAGAGSSIYEVFDDATNPIDLVGSGYTLVLTGASYTILPAFTMIVPPMSGDLGLADDEVRNVLLPTTGSWASGFSHPTGVATSLDVDSNGSVFLELGAVSDFTPSVGEFLGDPARVAPLATDLQPGSGGGAGTIHAEQDAMNPDLFHITWVNVSTFSGSSTADMQVTFDVSASSVEVKYGAAHTSSGNPGDGISGYTPGNGVSDPGPKDISVESAAGLTLGNDNPDIGFNSVGGDRPILGQVFDMEVTGLPSTSLGGSLLLFTGQLNPGFDLGLIGLATGCDFLITGIQIADLPIPAGVSPSAAISLDLTNAGANLAGFQLFGQAVVLGVPNVTPFGLGLSNGGAITIGLN